MRENRKNFIRVFLICLAIVALGTAAAAGAALYVSTARQRDEANEALLLSNMELSIRQMATRQNLIVTKMKEEEEADRMLRLRDAKNSFLQREREETLLLVNPWNPIPEDYEPRLVDIGDGMQFDERAAGALGKMLADCRKAGIVAVPISGYRTQEYQQGLFDDKLERVMSLGYTGERAFEKAAEEVAVPGTSEHQLALAMDILDVDNPNLDLTQEWTPAQRWLMAHCTDYGFILRYPTDTSEITGIIYEPWHYRYVGKKAAKEITEAGLTLEEYLQQQKPQENQ